MANLLEYAELYRDNFYGVASQMKIYSVEFRMTLEDALTVSSVLE
jgi:hypothetical protein